MDGESSKINVNTAWSRVSIQTETPLNRRTRFRLTESFNGATDTIAISTRPQRRTNAVRSSSDFLRVLDNSEAVAGFKKDKFDFAEGRMFRTNSVSEFLGQSAEIAGVAIKTRAARQIKEKFST